MDFELHVVLDGLDLQLEGLVLGPRVVRLAMRSPRLSENKLQAIKHHLAQSANETASSEAYFFGKVDETVAVILADVLPLLVSF